MNVDGKSVGVGITLGAAAAAVICAFVAILLFGKLQRQRDAARATIEQQREEIQQLQGKLAAATAELDTFVGMLNTVSQRPSPPAASQSPPLELLNVVHPGLGTAAAAVATAPSRMPARREVNCKPAPGKA